MKITTVKSDVGPVKFLSMGTNWLGLSFGHCRGVIHGQVLILGLVLAIGFTPLFGRNQEKAHERNKSEHRPAAE